MFYLITYGTLMCGNSRNYVLENYDAELVMSNCQLTEFEMLNFKSKYDNFPVLLVDRNNNNKSEFYFAEIYKCPDSLLPIIDNIEGINSKTGYGDMYIRVNVSNNDIPIYIYIGNKVFWNSIDKKYLSKCEYRKKWTANN